eukprot:2093874-Amphidinium_carterae.1
MHAGGCSHMVISVAEEHHKGCKFLKRLSRSSQKGQCFYVVSNIAARHANTETNLLPTLAS